MIGDRVTARVLASRVIAGVDPQLAAQLKLRPEQRALALLTSDIDDATYVAIDEATKQAGVEVVYAKSFYAGSHHASGPYSGEIIALLAAPNPAEAQAGLAAAVRSLEEEAFFYSASEDDQLVYFPHLVAACGSYLARTAGVPVGSSLSYLIAPPLEATWGLDAALKAAEVRLAQWYRPPTETNFGGALLTGPQEACRAACQAFEAAVLEVARLPRQY